MPIILRPLSPFLIRTFSTLLSLLSVQILSAQLVINPGTTFSLVSNVQMTLQNSDFANNGSFTPGNSQMSFVGNVGSVISGEQPIQFFGLEMNKTGNSAVVLQQPIGVTQRLLFTSGFLDLNGFNADLGFSGNLAGEHEGSRITGATGGQVICSAVLNAPVGANPGNLGAIITSSNDLGAVTIKRGHQPQSGGGMAGSVERFYDIVPTNNTGLNATLRFSYFEAELNGIGENVLGLFKSDDDINWSDIGFTARDTTANFVEEAGIGSFSRWTLSTESTPLPIKFLSFNAICKGNAVQLTWVTAQEQNSSHFDIERSEDAVRWEVIGQLPAAGNSVFGQTYSYTDQNTAATEYYRIVEYDLNGTALYTEIARSSCATGDAFSLSPNPAHDWIYVRIVTTGSSKAGIRLFDSRGALVKELEAAVSPGSNELRIDTRALAVGAYVVAAVWDNGQMSRTEQVVKQ